MWLKLYTVNYNGNGNTGWNTLSDATGTGFGQFDLIIINEDIVLYAIWSEFSLSGFTISGYSGNATEIIIPSVINTISILSIGNGAFSDKRLTSVVIPEGMTSIGALAFHSNRLETIVIPDSVITIGSKVCYNP